MAHYVRNAHRVLAPAAELLIELRSDGRNHYTVAGRDDLPGVEGEARDIAVRTADFFTPAVPENLGAEAQAASSITGMPRRRPIATIRVRLHGMPSWCTHRMAFVRS